MTDVKPLLTLSRYCDTRGEPLAGWTLASRRRRLAAWTVDLGLLAATLGIGWVVWNVVLWRDGTSPGKKMLGLTVFATDLRRPADRRRMALRALVHRTWARLFGLASFGLGYAYAVGGAAGQTRRTLYDDWAQTVVLARPGT